MKETILIVTIKEWNISNYFKLKERYHDKYDFYLITNQEELKKEEIASLNPRYIFFTHWSWMIPQSIYENFECVVFHMTDLPYGRGGSPLQNLIVRKVYNTKISAICVDEGMDTGDIYMKVDFDISTGSAEDIFVRLSDILFFTMIPQFLKDRPTAKKQLGNGEVFKRRKPEESNVLDNKDVTIVGLYDFIRMLDAEGYPAAFIQLDNLKIELSQADLKNGKIIGKFEVHSHE